jgi:pyrroline-5-carboxylate reductase
MHVLLVGCGRMGGALTSAWLGEHGVLVHDPFAAPPDGAQAVEVIDPGLLPDRLVVVVAVKPQGFPSLEPVLAPLASKDVLFVSIMAGLPLARLESGLGARVVRAMPNTAVAARRGFTAAVAGAGLSDGDRQRSEALFRRVGDFAWLEDEAEMDLVTALSGSGPAYFFRVTEALARAGEAAGLGADLARRLARATLIGSGALAEQRPEPVGVLRAEVTSPGGTTAAALARLEAGEAVDRLFDEAVRAAAARSRELAI